MQPPPPGQWSSGGPDTRRAAHLDNFGSVYKVERGGLKLPAADPCKQPPHRPSKTRRPPQSFLFCFVFYDPLSVLDSRHLEKSLCIYVSVSETEREGGQIESIHEFTHSEQKFSRLQNIEHLGALICLHMGHH